MVIGSSQWVKARVQAARSQENATRAFKKMEPRKSGVSRCSRVASKPWGSVVGGAGPVSLQGASR